MARVRELAVLHDQILITGMQALPARFTSHELINWLRQNRNRDYLANLRLYPGKLDRRYAEQWLHCLIARRLATRNDIVRQLGKVRSKNIRGHWSMVENWQRIR